MCRCLSWIWISSIVTTSVLAASPCTFCTRGTITTPDKAIEVPGYDFLSTCADVDLLLPLALTEDDSECQLLQSMSSYCGCPVREDSCTLCPDGSPVAQPDLEVSWFADEFGGIVPTCAMVEAFAASFAQSDDECRYALQLISSHCGCPAVEDHCEYCLGQPLKEEYYEKELPFLINEDFGNSGLGVKPTCGMLYETQYQLSRQHEFCWLSEQITFHCGCNDGILNYYGTSSKTQQAVLAWLPRAVALLSLVASILVLISILKVKKNRESVYHQLIAVIVVFDIVTSLVWIVGPAAIRSHDMVTGVYRGVYGTLDSANEHTCTAQGFFLQLGLTSVFMNVSLTVYYLLVVARGLREERLKQLRIWLFAPPLIFGFGFAFAVTPFVGVAFSVCQPHDVWIAFFLTALPVLISTAAILTMLVILYCKVRIQQRRSDRWSWKTLMRALSNGTSCFPSTQPTPRSTRTLEREVFFRCVSYALAFGITWPMLAAAQVRGIRSNVIDSGLPYPFWVVVLTVAPMQGFNNALSYFRPASRTIKRWRQRTSQAGEERHLEGENESSQISRFFRRFVESSFFLDSIECDEVDPVVELSNLRIVREFEGGTVSTTSRNADARGGHHDKTQECVTSNSDSNDSVKKVVSSNSLLDQNMDTLVDTSGDPTTSNGAVSSIEEISLESEADHGSNGSFSLRKEQTELPM